MLEKITTCTYWPEHNLKVCHEPFSQHRNTQIYPRSTIKLGTWSRNEVYVCDHPFTYLVAGEMATTVYQPIFGIGCSWHLRNLAMERYLLVFICTAGRTAVCIPIRLQSISQGMHPHPPTHARFYTRTHTHI